MCIYNTQFTSERKVLLKWNKKALFLVSTVLLFRNKKWTSKNETTFKHKEIINLVENETDFQNGKLTTDTFNTYFCPIVKRISIPKDHYFED